VNNTTYICQSCGQPLIEIDFNTSHCVRLCNNWRCRLNGQPQGYRELSDKEGRALSKRKNKRMIRRFTDGNGTRCRGNPEHRVANENRKLRAGYQPWLERKKENYHKLRGLDYSCKEAALNSSDKRMRELGIGGNS